MNGETQTPTPVDPLAAAIEPFRRRIRTLGMFYWEMAWRPHHFAEEPIRTPEPTSITRAVKHAVGMAAFWSGMQSFAFYLAKLLAQNPNETAFEVSGSLQTFVFVSAFFLQVVPMAVVLWLLTRRQALSFSR